MSWTERECILTELGGCRGARTRCARCRADLCAHHWIENHTVSYCLELEMSFPKDEAAISLGRRGGRRGGAIRAARLTPERRRQIAQHAARSRWAHKS